MKIKKERSEEAAVPAKGEVTAGQSLHCKVGKSGGEMFTEY